MKRKKANLQFVFDFVLLYFLFLSCLFTAALFVCVACSNLKNELTALGIHFDVWIVDIQSGGALGNENDIEN